jgi:hypothetical protein
LSLWGASFKSNCRRPGSNSTIKEWWFKKYPYTPPKKKKKGSTKRKGQARKRKHNKKEKVIRIMVTLKEGDKAPTFTGTDQDGKKISLND